MSREPRDDLTLLLTAASASANERVLQRLATRDFADLRYSHGFLIQHLVTGPIAVSTLAERLGITQQGASKALSELEAMGYTRRNVAEFDQRVRLAELTDRGWGAIEAARQARAAVTEELLGLLGADAPAFLAALRRLAEASGGLERLLSRRLRPEPAVASAGTGKQGELQEQPRHLGDPAH